jgi:hypothetical protein
MSDDWLKALKPGDDVGIEDSYRSRKTAKVVRFTPTGRIVTDSGKFAPDGWEIGASSWRKSHLIEITDALREEIEHKQLIERLSNQNWYKKHITTDQLRRIDSILKEQKA